MWHCYHDVFHLVMRASVHEMRKTRNQGVATLQAEALTGIPFIFYEISKNFIPQQVFEDYQLVVIHLVKVFVLYILA